MVGALVEVVETMIRMEVEAIVVEPVALTIAVGGMEMDMMLVEGLDGEVTTIRLRMGGLEMLVTILVGETKEVGYAFPYRQMIFLSSCSFLHFFLKGIHTSGLIYAI